jgi:hypothetical protein
MSRSSSRRGRGGRSRCRGRSGRRCCGGCPRGVAPRSMQEVRGSCVRRCHGPPARSRASRLSAASERRAARSGLDHCPSMYASPAPVSPSGPCAVPRPCRGHVSRPGDRRSCRRRRGAGRPVQQRSGSRSGCARPWPAPLARPRLRARAAEPGSAVRRLRRSGRYSCAHRTVSGPGGGTPAALVPWPLAVPWRWKAAPLSHRRRACQ